VPRSSIGPEGNLGGYGANSAVVRQGGVKNVPTRPQGSGGSGSGREREKERKEETTTPPGLPKSQPPPQQPKEEPVKKKGLMSRFSKKPVAPVDDDFLASLD
jgi:hypothetical protein